MLQPTATGLIYRNPRPHVRSVHAYFPSVVLLRNDELLACFALGEAFEAVDLHTCLARSADCGETWEYQGRLHPAKADCLTSDTGRLTVLPNGEVLALLCRCERDAHPEEGLTNPANLGFVPTRFLLLRSADNGRTWSQPRPVVPPVEGSSFEMCCPVTPLSDGRWLLPTSTWRGWDGHCPGGMRAVAFVSEDRGATWPYHLEVMADPQRRVIYWESKIVELPDGRLLATAWAYDEAAARDLPNHYALSPDRGHTWTPPLSTGLQGQTLTPLVLSDGRILSVYRRTDWAGLWAQLARLEGNTWVNEEEVLLWGAGAPGLAGGASMAENFQALRFGAPCLTDLGGSEVIVAFWCYEDCVSNIRWIRLSVHA